MLLGIAEDRYSPMALDYDNSAFYYFGMTMLGIYVIPTTFWILAYVYRE